jgi:hypothetical protein
MNLTTPYQDMVLNILRSDGKIVFYNDNGVERCAGLCCGNGDTISIRQDTIRRLVELKFIKFHCDRPALGIDTYLITKLGIEWLEANKIEPPKYLTDL